MEISGLFQHGDREESAFYGSMDWYAMISSSGFLLIFHSCSMLSAADSLTLWNGVEYGLKLSSCELAAFMFNG